MADRALELHFTQLPIVIGHKAKPGSAFARARGAIFHRLIHPLAERLEQERHIERLFHQDIGTGRLGQGALVGATGDDDDGQEWMELCTAFERRRPRRIR